MYRNRRPFNIQRNIDQICKNNKSCQNEFECGYRFTKYFLRKNFLLWCLNKTDIPVFHPHAIYPFITGCNGLMAHSHIILIANGLQRPDLRPSSICALEVWKGINSDWIFYMSNTKKTVLSLNAVWPFVSLPSPCVRLR